MRADEIHDLVLSAVRRAPIGIGMLDRELRYVFLNDALAEFNGTSVEEHLGRTVREVIPEVAPLVEPALRTVFETGRPLAAPEAQTGRPGDDRWFAPLLFPVTDEAGDVVAVTGVILETTERHQLEVELRQAQKMEAIGQLAGGIAHDFNNVLTAISGYADLALQQAEQEATKADLREIQSAAARARSLTQQLLAFSRKQVLRPELVDLNDVLLGLADLVRRLIGEDVELVLDLAQGLAPVRADRTQIEQIVMNLAVNARDAMPSGGRLVIETENRGDPEPEVVLAVSDTGTGIDDATRERLFEPFFTTKEPGRGTGLGLSTVYGIVSQSGGRIAVRSRAGEGARFEVHLPQAVAPDEPARSAHSARGGETILVVDDDPAVRMVVGRALEQDGYVVAAVETADEALRRVDEGGVDLVLTDVLLSESSGVELAEALAARARPLPVLFMSGHAPPLAGDASAPFIAKPFRVGELAAAIRALLDRRS